jgi:hypothetical protein
MARFKLGDKVKRIDERHDNDIVFTVVGVGPWGAAKNEMEAWYSLRDEPEVFIDGQDGRRGWFDAWERELVPA